jgi:patatin-like phospholipase/acyl hydrolase
MGRVRRSVAQFFTNRCHIPGGICGAFSAGFLAGIEEGIGQPLGRYFDLVAGTSTGGIIAAALAFGEPALRIEEFYRDRGPVIFERRKVVPSTWLKRRLRGLGLLAGWAAHRFGTELDCDYIVKTKYESGPLKDGLTQVFGNKRLGEAKTRLVIPSIDLVHGQTKVFKTRHLPHLDLDHRMPVVDVLMATTAAPTFFPHAEIQDGSAYVDGGLWANNPTMVAVVESMAIRERCRRPCDPVFDLRSTSALSIGTGKCQHFAKPPGDGAGAFWWMIGGRISAEICTEFPLPRLAADSIAVYT